MDQTAEPRVDLMRESKTMLELVRDPPEPAPGILGDDDTRNWFAYRIQLLERRWLYANYHLE